MKAKRLMDQVVVQLQGLTELQREAATLRENVLTAFVEQERKTTQLTA